MPASQPSISSHIFMICMATSPTETSKITRHSWRKHATLISWSNCVSVASKNVWHMPHPAIHYTPPIRLLDQYFTLYSKQDFYWWHKIIENIAINSKNMDSFQNSLCADAQRITQLSHHHLRSRFPPRKQQQRDSTRERHRHRPPYQRHHGWQIYNVIPLIYRRYAHGAAHRSKPESRQVNLQDGRITSRGCSAQ